MHGGAGGGVGGNIGGGDKDPWEVNPISKLSKPKHDLNIISIIQ